MAIEVVHATSQVTCRRLCQKVFERISLTYCFPVERLVALSDASLMSNPYYAIAQNRVWSDFTGFHVAGMLVDQSDCTSRCLRLTTSFDVGQGNVGTGRCWNSGVSCVCQIEGRCVAG